MFLSQVKSSRDVTTYVPWPDQKAEEHNVCLYVHCLCAPRNIRVQFVIPSRTTPFFILPRSPAPRLPGPHAPGAPELLQRTPPQLLQRSAGFTLPCPTLPRAKSSARRRSFFNAWPASPRPAPAAPGWRCLGRAPLAPAGAALPVRLGPGPSCCCCAHQPGLQPVPPHPSARAPISPATVAPIRPGSGWRRPTLAHPGCAPAAPASAAPTRFFFLLVCFFFFQALFFTLLCSRRWL
jgi:hypothetical protein